MNLCSLEDWDSLEDFLVKGLGISRSFVKKRGPGKKQLSRLVKKNSPLDISLDLLNGSNISPLYKGGEVRVIKELDDFLVLSKPTGIWSNPHLYSDGRNILSWLREGGHCPQALKGDPLNGGLLWRLDFGTSGLQVLVKCPKMHAQVSVLEKVYLALVTGDVPDEISLEHELTPFGPKGSLMKAIEGNSAHLKAKALKREGGVSLLAVWLQEGHRHQIRAQLSAAGYPILGDEDYGGPEAARLALHAYRYRLSWKGQEYYWQADVPSDLIDLFPSLDSGLKVLG